MTFVVADAFAKFKSRLELNDREQADVSARHYEVRDVVKQTFAVDRDFLTGSYDRYTKTKPLQDVDVMCVLNKEKEGHYLSGKSSKLIDALEKALIDVYGTDNVTPDRRCVTVHFGVKPEEEDEKVLSIDVVPAFADGKAYKIPDPGTAADWARTNPEKHAELATAANKAFQEEWKPLVKMIKKWNRTQGKPIDPSFLIEIMALELLFPPFSGGYIYELKSFFATASERIHDTWNDPAGYGPPVSDYMDAAKCKVAAAAMTAAGKHIDKAIQLKKQGRDADANRVWRDDIFGPMFPLS